MDKVGSTDPTGPFGRSPSPVPRLITILLLLPIGVLLLSGLATLFFAVLQFGDLALRRTTVDIWDVLTAISALFAIAAFTGAGLALRRRRPILALAFSALVIPTQFVAEGSRCDTDAACRLMGWAALPAGAFDWRVRIRPVTDSKEATDIASQVLSQSEPELTPFAAKRFGDHWMVSTIDRDGWPDGRAVRIEARTARTSRGACPEGRMRCGMERPVASDGRRVFRDDRSGVAAIFPASRAVCTARGADGEPLGLAARVRPTDVPCEVLDESRQMGVEIARSPKKGCASLDAPELPWRPLSPEVAKLFASQPALGAAPASACELHLHGSIQVSVYAFAAHPQKPGASPGPLYEAYIVTTPDHLAEDVGAFETFLKTASIGSRTGLRTP